VSGYTRLLVEKEGAVARVWLNRPDVRNAMDPETLNELAAAYKSLARDGSTRLAVIGGKGPDFCAGADIGWMRQAGRLPPAGRLKDARRLIDMCRAIDEAPFLTVARVHGNCYGGGLGIVASSDVVFAEEGARFCFSEVRLGIIPAVVSTFVLPKIGFGQARRWFLTAETFGPDTAVEIGLAHEAVPAGGLDARIEKLAAQSQQNGPAALAAAKAYLLRVQKLDRAGRIAHSAKLLAALRATPEAQEGLSAFLEKRPPRWLAAR
jgi:methylglutaconyl-CoA hydratase